MLLIDALWGPPELWNSPICNKSETSIPSPESIEEHLRGTFPYNPSQTSNRDKEIAPPSQGKTRKQESRDRRDVLLKWFAYVSKIDSGNNISSSFGSEKGFNDDNYLYELFELLLRHDLEASVRLACEHKVC